MGPPYRARHLAEIGSPWRPRGKPSGREDCNVSHRSGRRRVPLGAGVPPAASPWHDRAVTSSPIAAPYGAWASPFTSEFVTSTEIRLDAPAAAGSGLYWLEGRPTEGGRVVVVRRDPDGTTGDVTPDPFNARTRVHEYGGGAVAFAPDGTVYASNFADQRVYRIAPGSAPEPLTHAEGMRYADADVDVPRNRLLCGPEGPTRRGGGGAHG